MEQTADGKISSWGDVLTPHISGHSLQGARSLQATLSQEFSLGYDEGKKRCVVAPLDSHNVQLLDNVHPSQWTNPITEDR